MAGLRVVTDSGCDLSQELTSRHNITIVPLTIRFGTEEFLDRRDLNPADFWRRCKETGLLPETAAPAPGSFQEAFEQAADEGAEGVVCLTMSAGVSATFQSAVAAANAVQSRIKVAVVDTRMVTMGQGLLALYAAELAEESSDLQTIRSHLEAAIGRTRVYGVLDTLEHLQKGGRVGGAAALLGSLLSIKPVVQVRDGQVAEESKQRTRSRSLTYLANKVRGDAPLEQLAICDGAASDIDTIISLLHDVEVSKPMVVVDLGPVVGTHAGPGSVGVCYMVPMAAS